MSSMPSNNLENDIAELKRKLALVIEFLEKLQITGPMSSNHSAVANEARKRLPQIIADLQEHRGT
jgi:hypothetical protein